MPCRMDVPEFGPIRTPNRPNLKKFIALGDKATYSADVVREYLLTGTGLEPLEDHVGESFDFTHALSKLEADLTRDSNLQLMPDDTKIIQATQKAVREYRTADKLYIKIAAGGDLTDHQRTQVQKKQVSHREEDLRRLMKTFGVMGDRAKLQVVIVADPNLPLDPQLGFSPDDY